MDSALPPVPIPMAKLIIRYTHNLLLETEHDELDRWLEESDANLEVFEELTGGLEGKSSARMTLLLKPMIFWTPG